MRCLTAVFAFALALAACGGSSASVASDPPAADPPAAPATRAPGSAQVSGSVDGDALSMLDAVLVPGTHGARVVLVDRAGYCDDPDVEKSGSHVLTLDLGARGATSVDTGDYQVVEAFDDTSRALAARLDVIGHACTGTKQFVGRSGSASVTDATATRLSGSFTLALGRDTVTGTFVATSCVVPPPAAAVHCVD